jgi:hypothetical protein
MRAGGSQSVRERLQRGLTARESQRARTHLVRVKSNEDAIHSSVELGARRCQEFMQLRCLADRLELIRVQPKALSYVVERVPQLPDAVGRQVQ